MSHTEMAAAQTPERHAVDLQLEVLVVTAAPPGSEASTIVEARPS